MRYETKTLKHVAAVALIAACAAYPARASARTDNEVSARMSNAVVLDEGMAALSTNDRLMQVEIGYARALTSLSYGELWGEASWTAGTAESSLFGGQFDTRLFLHSFTLGARYALPIFSWLIPHARVGVGLGIGHFEIGPGNSASQAQNFEAGTSTAFGLSGYALAGVEVLVPTKSVRRGTHAFSVGIVIEGGFAFATSLGFDVSPERDEDKLLIPLEGATLGSFNPSGPVFRLGAVFRF